MPRKEGQKAKILALLRILEQQTDENHRMTVQQLTQELEKQGVPCERKSIYTDLDALRAMGYDIDLQRGPGGGYCLASRRFELPELKLLVDAVQSSRFITQKRSLALIEKLESLTSQYNGRLLHRQVFVLGRAKSDNQSAYYGVDTLHTAISQGRMVEFVYSDWGLDKKKHARRGGRPYQVSPWALAWENNSYYLIAYQEYEEPFGMRHYRVDKMSCVNVLEEPRRGGELYDGFNLSAYMRSMFNMYGGPVQDVTLRCENRMAGAMLDRFGTEMILLPEEDGEHFHFTVPVAVSPQFLGWVCGFDSAVEVTAPAAVRARLSELAASLTRMYPQK